MTVCGPLVLELLVLFFGTDGPKPLVDGAVVLGSVRSVVELPDVFVEPLEPAFVPPFASVSVFPTVIFPETRSFFATLAVFPAFFTLVELLELVPELVFFELEELDFVLDDFELVFLEPEVEALAFAPVRLVTSFVPSAA